MRGRLAQAVRDEFEHRKRRLRGDDLRRPVTRLRHGARGPTGGAAAAARLRAPLRGRPGRRVPGHRPGAVGIMRRAFGEQRRDAGLIADPKQAIYAFRGADVYAYLEAARRPRAPAPRCASTGAATRG